MTIFELEYSRMTMTFIATAFYYKRCACFLPLPHTTPSRRAAFGNILTISRLYYVHAASHHRPKYDAIDDYL